VRHKLLLLILVVAAVVTGYVLFNEHRQYSSAGGLAVAESIWGDVCGNLEPTVKFVHLPLPGQAGESDVKWLELPGSGRQYTQCDIKVDRAAVDSIPGVSNRKALCGVLVHEYGHLAGKDHSGDPNSVMFFKMSKRNIPDDC
jgi:Matrixin